MSDVVFILGAGASKQCGAPLMAEFLDVATNLLKTNSAGDKKEDFEKVFRAISSLQAVHSKSQLNLNNIEAVFNAFEISNVLKKLPGFEPEEIPSVIGSLKDLIVTTLEHTILFPVSEGYIDPPKPYGVFVELLSFIKGDAHPTHTVSVITFNYDIALDIAFHVSGIEPQYFVNDNGLSSHKIPYLKLHGSLNWAIRTDTNIVYPLGLKQYFSEYSLPHRTRSGTVKIPIGSQLKEYFDKTNVPVKPEPFIVPPSWNKAEQHQSLSNVWAQAAQELEQAEYIFIIGYSLPETDAFFRLLYALGTVGEKLLTKIIVFNPDQSGEVETRFRSMLGPGAEARFEYLKSTFEESLPLIKRLFPKRR